MATNPFNVEPPSWLQRIAQPSNAANALGSMAGRYIGAAGSALTTQPGQEKMNYGQRFRTDLANTYKQDADPMWRLREERMRTEMAQFGLNVQSFQFKNSLLQKTALQEAESMKEVEQLQSEVVKNGGGPHGILSTTYTGSNPKTQQYWNNTQLMASRQMTAMRINSDLTGLNRLIDAFDPESRSIALQVPRDETTRLPTPEGWATINALAAKNAARVEAEKKAKATTSVERTADAIFKYEGLARELEEFGDAEGAKEAMEKAKYMRAQGKQPEGADQQYKNLPKEAQILERRRFYADKGDTEGVATMDGALARLMSQQMSKTDHTLLVDALSRQRKAESQLAEGKTQIIGEAAKAARQNYERAAADVARLVSLAAKETPEAPAPKGEAPAVTNAPTKFIFKDGELVPQ